MALAKTGTGITELKGKFAGNVFRHDSSGQHIQSTPRVVSKEPTATQRKRRNAYRTCLNYIQTHSTDKLMSQWQTYATHHPHTNKLSETVTLTWLQAFMRINIIRAYNDVEILQYPPND